MQIMHSMLTTATITGLMLAVVTTGPSLMSTARAQKTVEGDRIATSQGDLTIQPLNHATFAMEWQDKVLYVDPVGGAERFESLPPPDLILITHEHPDHLDPETLSAVVDDDTVIVTTETVQEMLPSVLAEKAQVLANGDTANVLDIPIKAVPAYNITPDRLQYHPKGRGNGYVLTLGDQRVYVAGDTEDTPEMRALSDIDIAFVPMNLPYTMTVEQAADAVRAFQPGIVYPYHSRGSDVEEFARLVGDDVGVEVRLRDWY